MTQSANRALPPEARDVLAFWFDDLEPEQWWKPDPALDKVVRDRFESLYEQVSRGVPETWLESASGRLAAIIVLDQFPRNMYRRSRRAFATDAQALALARESVDLGLHEELEKQEKGFLFMPFQHSEDTGVQGRSVALFETLGDPEQLKFAEQHKQVIDRFGRFPHRNAWLGRASTAEEIAFLEEPGLFW